MTDRPSTAARRRGRPPSKSEAERAASAVERAETKAKRDKAIAALDEAERPKHVAVAAPLSDDQRARLAVGVGKIAEVRLLSSQQLEVLLSELAYRLPFYIVARAILPEKIASKRGPKPKLGIPHLLIDCVKTWEAATGERLRIWETSGTEREAIPCKIARVALQVVDNLAAPFAGSLHHHISTARRTLVEPHTSVL